MSNDIFKQAAQFNKSVCGIATPQRATKLSPDRLKFFFTCALEELEELGGAYTAEEQVDALVDLMYFAAGRVYEIGANGAIAARLIHEANMQKVRGELAKRPGSKGHDAIKPPGWTAPNLKPALNQKPKIVVLGHGRHGKDTVSGLLSYFGLSFTSSSLYCAKHVVRPALARMGITYISDEACYNDRHNGNNRTLWFNIISEYTKDDKARLARQIFNEYDIYCGLRSAEELVAVIKAGLVDHIIWVDRSRVAEPESSESMTVTRAMADHVVDNNGSLNDLMHNTFDLATKQLQLSLPKV